MKLKLILAIIFQSVLIQAQNWKLKLSSNVEIVNWKLTSVADKSQKSLQGASIVLTKSGAVIEETTTNGDGDFTVMVPPNGEFLLTVSYPGYNTKRFSINTHNVPEDFAKDDYKPTFSIGGFIMAKAFPGIDYSGLQKPLVLVEFKQKKKVFDHDEVVTENGLAIVTKIYNDESKLIQEFCSTNKKGDVALAKPDCPLAKMLYEKAISLIPGEPYPVEQLAKVGQCLKDKEEAEKKASEQKALAAEKAKAEAEAKEKAKADKLAADKAAREKAEQEKQTKAQAPAQTAVKSNTNTVKQKPVDDKAQKQKEGIAKAKAEDEAEAKSIEEKKKADRLAKQKEKEEKERKQKEGMAKAKAEDEAEARAEEEKRLARQKEKEAMKKQTEAEDGETDMGKRNTKHGIYNVLGGDKYKENIKKADDFYKMKRWAEAKSAYEEALKVKPDDAYAKSRIEQSEKMISNGQPK
jgi:hypothetical protein